MNNNLSNGSIFLALKLAKMQTLLMQQWLFACMQKVANDFEPLMKM